MFVFKVCSCFLFIIYCIQCVPVSDLDSNEQLLSKAEGVPKDLKPKYDEFGEKMKKIREFAKDGCEILKLADEFVSFARKSLQNQPTAWKEHLNIARKFIHETVPKNPEQVGCIDGSLPKNEELAAILPVLPAGTNAKDLKQTNLVITNFYNQVISGKKTTKDQVETKDGRSTKELLQKIGVKFK